MLVVVEGERGPGGRRHPEAAHERLGAVVARSDAHPELVEDLGHVVGVDVAQGQRQHAAPVVPGRGPEDPAVVTEPLVESLERVAR